MDWLAAPDYWLARFAFRRALAFISLIAFPVTVHHFSPPLGERGLLPVPDFVRAVPFGRSPSLFHLRYSDPLLLAIAWSGVLLAAVAALGVFDGPEWPVPVTMAVWALLWALYLSIVNVGQTFYSFGWESLLLEAGFLAIFLPQPIASVAGLIVFVTQSWLVLSGNFSWLNFITMTLAIASFDNAALGRVFAIMPYQPQPTPTWYVAIVLAITALILALSYRPTRNLLSRRQLMNYSFDPFHIVGTYGAFGSITKDRFEVVIEGTEEAVLTPQTKWHEYEFQGKPGDVRRQPPQVAPYHYRLDWLMWFAALSSPMYHEWFVPLRRELLEADRAVLRLLARDPFAGR